jgi:hypothetical protein
MTVLSLLTTGLNPCTNGCSPLHRMLKKDQHLTWQFVMDTHGAVWWLSRSVPLGEPVIELLYCAWTAPAVVMIQSDPGTARPPILK